MSTALAIASVTAVLRDLLNNGLIDHDVTGVIGGNVTVTALPPDRIETTGPNAHTQLNLFLYQVTPNQGWRNVGLPSRDGHGERVSNPLLALNLHYLLTAYGIEEFHAEILLGYGMQLLHETPVLTRAAIRRSLAPPSPVIGGSGLPPEMQTLFTSELAEQVEQIKIIPQSMGTEEISRLWPALQAKYRPTAVYQASVVLIESRQSTKSALPVRARNIYVMPFRQPIIEQIRSQAQTGDPIVADQPILAGYSLVIVGKQLRGEDTLVNVGGIEVTPAAGDVSDTQITITIPATLPAGVQGLQVIQRTLMGLPPTPHRGVESNVAAFVLRPRIEALSVDNPQSGAGGLFSATINVSVRPAVGEAQRVVLLLNELAPTLVSPPVTTDILPLAYSFNAPPRTLASPPGPTENLAIPISGVRAGTYLARVQVDGAESPLIVDTNPLSPTFNRYIDPKVTIT
jgi:hypothetical protein